MRRNFVQLLLIHLSLIGTLIFFQNCGQSFESQKIEELGLPSQDGSLGDDDENPDPAPEVPPPIPSVCTNGESQFGYLVESALSPMTCGDLIIKNCVEGQWSRNETLYPTCQQMCLHPQSQQAVLAGSMYFSFSTAQASTQALCDAARVTSTCSQQTGLFSPAPAANASCMVQGQTCAYTTGAGISNPTGNMSGASVTGFAAQTATYPTLCGSQVTRTCQSSGNWNGSTPLYTACQQLCLHPDTNQPVAQNSNYSFYTRQSGTEAECQAARITSVCQASTGLFSPSVSQTRFQTCTVTAPPPPVSGTVRANIRVTRISGPAPLAVSFDASRSTDSNPATTDVFRQLTYNFDAGDGNAATHTISGELKRRHSGGPIFAYVYETPSNTPYRARVRVQNSSGSWDIAEVEITVQDPNVVYSGTNTICVANPAPVAGQNGCPQGAAVSTSLPSGNAWTNKRVLLRRGQTFSGFGLEGGVNNVQVGAFGTGAAPVVGGVSTGSGVSGTAGVHPRNLVVMDLQVTGNFSGPVAGSDVLVLRSRFENSAGQDNYFDFGGTATGYYRSNPPSGWNASQIPNPRRLFFFENFIANTGAYGLLVDSALVGNTVHAQAPAQHSVRVWRGLRTYVGHNHFGRVGDEIRHSLKFHGGNLTLCDGLNIETSTIDCATQKVVIANNRFGETSNANAWTVTIAPENTTSSQGLEDVIVENNVFLRGPNTNADIIFVGRRLTDRGNRRQDNGVMSVGTPSSTLGNCGGYSGALPSQWCGPYFIRQEALTPSWP